MMDDYLAVKQLLFDIEHPAKAKFVAEDIERHAQDPRFVSLLQHAIRDQQLPFNTQLAGAVVLSRILSQMYFSCDQQILADSVMDLIKDMRVEYRIKQTLQLNLTSIIEVSSQSLFTQLVIKAAEIIIMGRQDNNTEMEAENVGNSSDSLKSAVLILRCLLNSHAHFPVLAKAVLQEFLNSTISSIKGFSVKQINALISVAQFWKVVLEKARNGATKEHFELLRELARSQNLTQWVFFLYQHDYLPGQQCFINPKSASDHQHIAKLKVSAANLHKQILIGLEVSQAMNEQITNRHLSQTTGIINTICVFVSFKANCEAYQYFIIQLIGIIILLIKLFRRQFEQSYDRILHIIAFPLLSITEEQQQLFADDPAEFNNLAQDCCDKQSYGILKTEAARLIETICDDIKSAATYTIQHAIISLKVRFNVDASFSHNSQHFLNVQQALTVLAILSYQIGKHQRQLKEVRNILTVQEVKAKVTPLQLTRIFQFLAYNYQELYPHYQLGQNWVYLALNVSVQQVQNYPSLVYSALDFISNVFENCFIQRVAMKYLEHNNYSKNYDIRYKILQKIIARYFTKFSDQGLSLALDKLLEVVLIDLQNYKKKKKSHTMDITHSLQTCRKIAERHQLIKEGTKVRASIWKFILYLQVFRKIDLDDQIVKIVISLVKCEGISAEVSQIIPKLIQIFRQEYGQSIYIVFINQIAFRIGETVASSLLYPLLEGATHLHTKLREKPTSVTDSLALGNVLIVLQHIILIYGEKMSAQILQEVVKITMMIIPALELPEKKIEPIIIGRALNLLFICHMHKSDDTALRKMLQFSDEVLFRGHDLNILTLFLTKKIFRQSDIISVTQMIILLVNALWKARQNPQIKSKKSTNVQIRSTVVKIHKIANYEASLKNMTKPFASDLVPEFQIRQTLQKMSTNNNYLYQSIMNSLPSKIAQRLRELISQVTIQGRRRKIIKTGNDKLKSWQLNVPSPIKRSYQQQQQEGQMNQENEGSLRKGLLKKKRKQQEMSSAKL